MHSDKGEWVKCVRCLCCAYLRTTNNDLRCWGPKDIVTASSLATFPHTNGAQCAKRRSICCAQFVSFHSSNRVLVRNAQTQPNLESIDAVEFMEEHYFLFPTWVLMLRHKVDNLALGVGNRAIQHIGVDGIQVGLQRAPSPLWSSYWRICTYAGTPWSA